MLIRSLKTALGFTRQVRRGERGQALVFVVLLLAAIGGMSALAIDLGSYTADRRDMQNAADAIALAAAQDMPNADAAHATANSWQTKNKVGNATMTVTVTQQSLPNTPNPTVKVTLTRSHAFTFAGILGISSSNVSANATAIRTSPGGSAGLVPWSVQKSMLNLVAPGQTTTLKYDSNNATSGNFGAIRLDGNGSNVYRDTLEFGSENSLCAAGVSGCPYPSTVDMETGNMVGSTRAGVDYLISNTAPSCDTWAEVTTIVNGNVRLNSTCNPFIAGGNSNSLRIIIIPVLNNLCNGSCTVTITEFALFFVEGYASSGCSGNHCDIKGRFINSNTNYGAEVGVFNANTLAHFIKLTQ